MRIVMRTNHRSVLENFDNLSVAAEAIFDH